MDADLSLSVSRPNWKAVNMALASIWLVGAGVLLLLNAHAWLQLRKIKQSSLPISNKDVCALFEDCARELNISKTFVLAESPLITSPMTFGVYRTFVLLPCHFEQGLSKEEIKHIFLHELCHYKQKDTLINYVIVLYQIIYWFNPIVWIAFREMRLDREIACDTAVLNSLDQQSYRSYGQTIIHFIDQSPKNRNTTLANQLNGPKSQIRKRIEQIASYQPESRKKKLKSIGIFMLVMLFVCSQIPFVSVMAADQSRYNFQHEHVNYKDYSSYFGDNEGSFVLYDMKMDEFTLYNHDQSTLRVSPNSTYKIYSALFGLESDVIATDHSTLEWNGRNYPYESWNKDQDLSSAMANSVTWYFQYVDKQLHTDAIQTHLEQIGYGNANISGGLEEYWMESSLRISPVEQVELLHAFYMNEFEFKEKNTQAVKDALQLDEKNGRVLSGKTGTGMVNGKSTNGWFIGYIETSENTYFFAANIQAENQATGSNAADIALSILSDKGIYSISSNHFLDIK